MRAETRDRTGDLQIFGLTLSQLSYRGHTKIATNAANPPTHTHSRANAPTQHII